MNILKLNILAFLTIACVSFTSCDDDDENDDKVNSAKFMQDVANSNIFEISTSIMARDSASTVDVRNFAQQMVNDHTAASNELKTLAQQKGVTLPDTMDIAKQQTYASLSQRTGLDFDRNYMDEMEKIHQSDVSKFEAASKNADDTDVKAWATKLLPTLKMHREMAAELEDKLNNNNAQ